MTASDDPVEGRLIDALSRLRELERAAQRGESIPPDTIITEVRAIRDDLLAERRSTAKDIVELRRTKVDKNPTAARVFWIGLTAAIGVGATLIVGLVQAAGGG